ncbi:MAG: DUF3038 domain-containing protein [Microcystis aeruginosa]
MYMVRSPKSLGGAVGATLGNAPYGDYQELIRRAVDLLAEMTANNQKPHQTALLGDYIDVFCNTYP